MEKVIIFSNSLEKIAFIMVIDIIVVFAEANSFEDCCQFRCSNLNFFDFSQVFYTLNHLDCCNSN